MHLQHDHDHQRKLTPSIAAAALALAAGAAVFGVRAEEAAAPPAENSAQEAPPKLAPGTLSTLAIIGGLAIGSGVYLTRGGGASADSVPLLAGPNVNDPWQGRWNGTATVSWNINAFVGGHFIGRFTCNVNATFAGAVDSARTMSGTVRGASATCTSVSGDPVPSDLVAHVLTLLHPDFSGVTARPRGIGQATADLPSFTPTGIPPFGTDMRCIYGGSITLDINRHSMQGFNHCQARADHGLESDRQFDGIWIFLGSGPS